MTKMQLGITTSWILASGRGERTGSLEWGHLCSQWVGITTAKPYNDIGVDTWNKHCPLPLGLWTLRREKCTWQFCDLQLSADAWQSYDGHSSLCRVHLKASILTVIQIWQLTVCLSSFEAKEQMHCEIWSVWFGSPAAVQGPLSGVWDCERETERESDGSSERAREHVCCVCVHTSARESPQILQSEKHSPSSVISF